MTIHSSSSPASFFFNFISCPLSVGCTVQEGTGVHGTGDHLGRLSNEMSYPNPNRQNLFRVFFCFQYLANRVEGLGLVF